ncbi:hypothetical protein C0Z11_07010 [Acidipropionibacterium jensenii]|uniref:hypothetical protein n=1 Tax=Acidipropionibacterium jensenii TaxID=1749 RepID=UPI000BEF14D3|nr:hypothetical protein [Acidipropionibacterium jensenii]AZZ43304.1 hypothetical protein C0Z11_07010 [Acidipropionibacterium jensenii]
MGIFTDLNLNGRAPVRVQPKIGEWGPRGVPSTRAKKVQRIIAPIVFVLVLAGLAGLFYFFYRILIPQG